MSPAVYINAECPRCECATLERIMLEGETFTVMFKRDTINARCVNCQLVSEWKKNKGAGEYEKKWCLAYGETIH